MTEDVIKEYKMKEKKGEKTTVEERKWENIRGNAIFPSYTYINFPFLSSLPTFLPFFLFPSSMLPPLPLHLLLPLSSPLFTPPSLPSLHLVHSSTSFLCPSLPVSPVYEGKFIGLPGAVSWRWPPLLKPQQGCPLHMEQKQPGLTGLFPSPHITRDGTLTPPIIY